MNLHLRNIPNPFTSEMIKLVESAQKNASDYFRLQGRDVATWSGVIYDHPVTAEEIPKKDLSGNKIEAVIYLSERMLICPKENFDFESFMKFTWWKCTEERFIGFIHIAITETDSRRKVTAYKVYEFGPVAKFLEDKDLTEKLL